MIRPSFFMDLFTLESKNVGPIDGAIDHHRLISLWKEVEQYFGTNSVRVGSGRESKLEIDASEIRSRLFSMAPENCGEYLRDAYVEHSERGGDVKKWNPFAASLKIGVSEGGWSDKHERHVFVTRFIETLFLAMNLAVEEGCELPGMTLECNGEIVSEGRSLSAFDLSNAWRVARKSAWPRIEELPFAVVWSWLERQDTVTFLLAKTPVAKAIATLIRFSYRGDMEATDIVQVSQVLESLLLDKAEPQRRGLERKIPLVLGLMPEGLKRWVAEFYKLRSDIVHGNAVIFRPYFGDTDTGFQSVEPHYSHLDQMLAQGLAVVVGLLQDLIRTNSASYRFEENITVFRGK